MDRTQLFKASVMTLKLQRKNELATAGSKTDKNRVLPKTGHPAANTEERDEFARQAKEICNKITSLRNVLLENRTAYMRIGQHLKSAATMTDEHRDIIDRESEKFVTFYTQRLAKMRVDWKSVKRKPQEREHIETVLDILVNYLHSVQQIYLDQKKYRVQHELETHRLLKLAADRKKIPIRPAGKQIGRLRRKTPGSNDGAVTDENDSTSKENDVSDWNDSWEWSNDDDIDVNDERNDSSADVKILQTKQMNNNKQNIRRRQNGRRKKSSSTTIEPSLQRANIAVEDDDTQKSAQLINAEDDANVPSSEDVQMFEEENIQLYLELQGLSEEVEQIEKNVVDIAQLQDIFTEKVSLQHQNIERIVNNVVGATENVKDANEQIRQATQRNAGMRFWSMFFLLVMSFSLLFLDWYYD